MSQLALSDGQPGNWEEPDFFLRRLEIVRFQANGWQEPCESRGSSTELWERGGEIPLRHPTILYIRKYYYGFQNKLMGSTPGIMIKFYSLESLCFPS